MPKKKTARERATIVWLKSLTDAMKQAEKCGDMLLAAEIAYKVIAVQDELKRQK